LRGARRSAVLRALGPSGLPDDETPADQHDTWVFYLGPDNLGIDDENLYVRFDREGRATAITTNAASPDAKRIS
jgi:hypothetical protein